MSGPKVVRIVTREELLEICRGHLARLDAAVAHWERTCGRSGAATEADIKAMRQRSAEIAALLGKERYMDLQKRVPDEIQWIEADLIRRLEIAAKKKAEARIQSRRRSSLAQQLLQRGGLSVELSRDLSLVASSDDMDGPRAEAIIGAALRSSVSASRNDDQSATMKALAQRLSTGQEVQSLDAWLAANPSPEEIDATGDKIDAAIAALTVAGALEDAAGLSARHRSILAEPPSSARKMRADSLLMEIARALEKRRNQDRQSALLEQLLAEARAALKPADSLLLAEADDVLARQDVEAFAAITIRLSQAIESGRKAEAAKARRRAVLSALAEAGYEAREGMQTSKPGDTGVVLRRASTPDMGVEIAGGNGTSRLQMRPVRFASVGVGQDAGKDRDIETIWCRDFDILQKRLRELKADIALERAMPIGAAPVMVVETPSESRAGLRETAKPMRTSGV